ncbi:hypothetical protein F4777DRAFT_569622 [Nemania sp. FL0916]|nr:hypothetical protein F4777DRAFT_569622 [Nemania sp. FL0916]
MPEYDYFKISTSGRPHFARSRSFSHHHRPRHSHTHTHARTQCPENCACVTLEDWNALLEDNRTLKADLRGVSVELQRAREEGERLRKTHGLHDEEFAARFRRRIAGLKAEVDNKELELRDLGKAKDHADVRVRELSQTVSDQAGEIATLEDSLARLGRAHQKDQHALGVRTEEAREAWSLVGELRRQLRKCRDPLPFRRRYDFA